MNIPLLKTYTHESLYLISFKCFNKDVMWFIRGTKKSKMTLKKRNEQKKYFHGVILKTFM